MVFGPDVLPRNYQTFDTLFSSVEGILFPHHGSDTMRRLFGCTVAIAVLLSVTFPVFARVIAPPPLTQRIAVADTIILGRVTAIEDMDVEAAVLPGGDKVKYRIAIVTSNQTIRGKSEKMSTKVGFRVPAVQGKIGPKYPMANLQPGREYVLLLQKHHEGKFLQVELYVDAIELAPGGKSDADIAQIKRCVKLIDNPKAALQSKDEADRLLTATMLIQKYRGRPAVKTEPIDAEESQLILKALQSVKDWGKYDPITRTNPVILFQQLGLTEKDGFRPLVNVKDYNRDWGAAAQAWLEKHAATYRIQRFVAP
jgi:hypothetical protein